MLLLGADDAEASALVDIARCQVETFGLNERADWYAAEILQGETTTGFKVIHKGALTAQVMLPLLGTFNVQNALATFAAASAYGIEPSVTASALARFLGVRRRLEVCGVVGGVTVYDDFAHHPSAVRENASGCSGCDEGRSTLGGLRTTVGYRVPENFSGAVCGCFKIC